MKLAKKPKAAEPLTDEFLSSGADLSAFMKNPRQAPALLTTQKVNVDFPEWVVGALDRAADLRGVPRQSLIKMWIVDRLQREGQTA